MSRMGDAAAAPVRAGATARRRRTPTATKPMPSAIARMLITCSGCATSSMTPFFASHSPRPAGGDDDAGLDRPEDAVERRAHRPRGAGPSRRRAERRGEETLAGRRLHVGEQVLVRRQPIDDLGVRVHLDLRRAQPAAMVDRRADQPRQRDDAGHDAEQDLEADEDVLDGAHRAAARCRSTAAAAARRRGRTPGCAPPRDAAPDKRPATDTAPGSPASVSSDGSSRSTWPTDGGYCSRIWCSRSCVSRGVVLVRGGRRRRRRFGLPGAAGFVWAGPAPAAGSAASSIHVKSVILCRHYPLYTQAAAGS